MDFPTFVLSRSQGFQPRIGEEVMIILSAEVLLCTYLGLKLTETYKCVHAYVHNKSSEIFESVQQVGVPTEYGLGLLN